MGLELFHLREGLFHLFFKQALVTPLIKKKTLCRNEFMNYRPISNLSFLSKILEKIVAKRLNAHIEEQLLSNHVQPAYKRFHSNETAILKIHNDIICNGDQGLTLAMCPLARVHFLGCRATTIHFLLARGASDFHFGGKHFHYFFR